jgi:hypothetical protein
VVVGCRGRERHYSLGTLRPFWTGRRIGHIA